MPVRVETFERIDQAAQALAANRDARAFGGGTILMRAVNEGDQTFNTLIRTSDPALKEIRVEGSAITIGAGVTMNALRGNRDTAFLDQVARAVGGPQVRNMATVGGNLFAKPPFGDFATGLLALGATVNFAGGESAMAMDDFLKDRDRLAGQLVRSVSVPRINDPGDFRFLKVTRVKPKGVAIMSIAAFLPRSSARLSGCRIAFGNMGPVPVRAVGAERALEGGTLDEAHVARAQAGVLEGLNPHNDEIASEWYRREVAPVHLKRVLLGTGARS